MIGKRIAIALPIFAAALTSAAIPVAAANASTSIVRPLASREAAVGVKHYLHSPYYYGGASPSTGFDCSGLAQWVYKDYAHVSIPRTTEAQYQYFRREPESKAWGGDLVFFHKTSNPNSLVYHTGIYEGGGQMVSALNPRLNIEWTPVWWGGSYPTFGTISH